MSCWLLQMALRLAQCLIADPVISSPSRDPLAGATPEPLPRDRMAEQLPSARSPCLPEMSEPLVCKQRNNLVTLQGRWMSKVQCLVRAVRHLVCSRVTALCCDMMRGWAQHLSPSWNVFLLDNLFFHFLSNYAPST